MNLHLLISGIFKRCIRHKFKSFLMMLGVIIGVISLVASITVGTGIKASIMENLTNSFLPNNIGLISIGSSIGDRELTLDDISAVTNSVSGVSLWTPLIPGGRKNVNVPGYNHNAAITGVDVSAQIVMGQPAIEGEYFSQFDIQRRNSVVLIGETVKQELFPKQSALGKHLEFDKQVFTVLGVLKSLGSDPHGGNLDNVILLPYTTLMQMTKRDNIGSVRFMVEDTNSSARLANEITVVMKQQHNISEGENNDFLISTSPRGIEMIDDIESIFMLIVPIIVGIIFVISGIVIAIIMQISIKQRTAEIGLRKALGARPMDLENQFLAETTLLTLAGALIGILLSFPLMQYSEYFYAGMGGTLSLQPSLMVIGLSLICSILVGLLAGFLPARKAAALVPVEALR